MIPFGLRRRLDITPSELLIVALIHGFSQDGETWFCGSTDYIAQWVGIAKRNVLARLKALTDRGILIKRIDCGFGAQKKCMYKVNDRIFEDGDETSPGVVMKHHSGGDETSPGVVMKHHPDNIEDNNIKNNIGDNIGSARAREKREGNLFDCDENESAITIVSATPQKRKIAQKEKCAVSLFRESEAAKLVSYLPDGSPDASKLFAMFPGKKYENVDMLYYYEAVADWSDSADKKRTARGWIATIRRFVEMDRERGKLHMIFPAGAKTAVENFIDDMTIPEGY